MMSQMTSSRTEVCGENGVASGGDPQEVQAAIRIMQEGGNAIDALVASAFAGYVVEPGNCGIGGYGRASVFLAKTQQFVTIDHYVRAPQNARADMFKLAPDAPVHYYGHPETIGRQAEEGYLATAVPGAVPGLYKTHQLFGKLPWAQLLEPAIELADAGLPMNWNVMSHITAEFESIKKYRHLSDWLMPGGKFPSLTLGGYGADAAEKIDTSALAKTLRLIAQKGDKALREGPIVDAILRASQQNGGILCADDFARYQPKVLREVTGSYRGVDYITANDSLGYEALNILDQFDLSALGADSAAFRHLAAEAFAQAFVDNQTHYGDPDFVASPVNGLISREFARLRASQIDIGKVQARPVTAADPWPFDNRALAPEKLSTSPTLGKNGGTSMMATADKSGNICALTTSFSAIFGGKVYVPEVGVIMNNSMQNFDPRPDHPNAIAPGKMPIFGAPVMVAARDGQGVFAGCGAGGYRILTAVLHAFIHQIDFGMGIQAAIDAPRVHNQGRETVVDERIPNEVRKQLMALGHQLEIAEGLPGVWKMGRVAGISRDPKTGLLCGGSGTPWNTAAMAF